MKVMTQNLYSQPLHQKSLLSDFLGKEVTVEAEGYTCLGMLIRYESGNKKLHIPYVLILKSLKGYWIMVRSWQIIKSVG